MTKRWLKGPPYSIPRMKICLHPLLALSGVRQTTEFVANHWFVGKKRSHPRNWRKDGARVRPTVSHTWRKDAPSSFGTLLFCLAFWIPRLTRNTTTCLRHLLSRRFSGFLMTKLRINKSQGKYNSRTHSQSYCRPQSVQFRNDDKSLSHPQGRCYKSR